MAAEDSLIKDDANRPGYTLRGKLGARRPSHYTLAQMQGGGYALLPESVPLARDAAAPAPHLPGSVPLRWYCSDFALA